MAITKLKYDKSKTEYSKLIPTLFSKETPSKSSDSEKNSSDTTPQTCLPFSIQYALMKLESQLLACEMGSLNFDQVHESLNQVQTQLEHFFRSNKRVHA